VTPAVLCPRADGKPLVVGHRGAAALERENSLEAVQTALRLGVDLVELDVVARADGSLAVAHDVHAAIAAPSLDEALELLASSPAGLLLDLKAPGIEAAAVATLRRHDLVERTLACSLSADALRRCSDAEPRLARSLSYPDDRLRLAQRPALEPVVRGGLMTLRATMPVRAPRWARAHGLDALTLQWLLVTPRLVERCHAAGVAVLAWTLQSREAANRLSSMGIDAMIADDPRILMEMPPS
jgi:glycerophosphoryl diester phosphodiesterase